MIISCTKKLQDELGIKPSLLMTEKPIYSWHANIVRVNRRKTVVLVNDASLYNIILYGLKAKYFKNIENTILLGIREILLSDGVNDVCQDTCRKKISVRYSDVLVSEFSINSTLI